MSSNSLNVFDVYHPVIFFFLNTSITLFLVRRKGYRYGHKYDLHLNYLNCFFSMSCNAFNIIYSSFFFSDRYIDSKIILSWVWQMMFNFQIRYLGMWFKMPSPPWKKKKPLRRWQETLNLLGNLLKKRTSLLIQMQGNILYKKRSLDWWLETDWVKKNL